MKLSIVVPVYNLEKYIARALDSLLAIKFDWDYEIIVVNDGSTDCSEDIIKQYQLFNKQIKLISIKNEGVSNARNIGIANSTGDYITFVDGDDSVMPEFFNDAVSELESSDFDIVQYNYLKVDDSEIFDCKQFTNERLELHDSLEIMCLFCGRNNLISYTVWGKVYRHSIIEGVYFDTTMAVAEDVKFLFDVLLKTKSVIIFDKVGYLYYQRGNSATHSMSVVEHLDKIRCSEYMMKYLTSEELIKNVKCGVLYSWLDIYYLQVIHNEDNRCALQNIRKVKLISILNAVELKTLLKVFLIKYDNPLFNMYIRNKFL